MAPNTRIQRRNTGFLIKHTFLEMDWSPSGMLELRNHRRLQRRLVLKALRDFRCQLTSIRE